MANFLTDNTALPFPKTAFRTRDDVPASQKIRPEDWQAVCQGLTDLRGFLRAQVPVNLRAVGCVPRDPSKRADNIGIINQLLAAARTASRPIVLDVDDFFYIGKAGTNWSIYMQEGSVDQFIIGRGRFSSGFIQHDTGTGNDWFGLLADRTQRCGIANLGMMQGEIDIPSTGQHDHLVQVANFGGASDSGEFTIAGCHFGKCLGDAINVYGGSGVVRLSARDFSINGYGFVLKTWSPLTAYALGSMVRIGTSCYYATTGGVSGTVEPSTTGAGIADGTVVWSTIVGGATYRFGARSGIAFQRGYDRVNIEGFHIAGIQNSGIDMESTGVGTCRFANITNGVINNGTTSPDAVTGQKGNTATCFSFSGSNSLSDPTKYSTVENVTVINGSMQIAETRGARISRVRIVQEEAPLADTNTACMYALRDNTGLVIDSCQLHRIGTSDAGELLNIQGTGNITLTGAWALEQATAADLIGVEGSNDLRFDGSFDWTYSGSSPSSRAVVNMTALNRDMDRPIVRGFRGKSTSGAMKAFAVLAARNDHAMRDITIADNQCEDGSVLTGIYFSKDVGCQLDTQPMILGCNFGGASLFTQVDIGDTPVDNYVFPIIAGNRDSTRTHVSKVDPTNNVRAPQGSTCVWEAGNSTKLYFKMTGTGAGGWAEVTGLGAPSVVELDGPTDATSWDTHITENGLDVDPPTLSWSGDDAGGDIAAAIGAIDLIASGAVTYGEDETGYPADQFVGIPDAGAGTGFSTTNAGLADPSATSRLLIVIGRLMSVPAAGRGLFHIAENDQIRISNVGGAARARLLLANNDVTPATDLDTSAVDVWIVQVNETTNSCFFAVQAFKATPAYTSPTAASRRVGVGGFDATSAPFRARRIYYWEGAPAEMTQAQLKALAESFGAGMEWIAS